MFLKENILNVCFFFFANFNYISCIDFYKISNTKIFLTLHPSEDTALVSRRPGLLPDSSPSTTLVPTWPTCLGNQADTARKEDPAGVLGGSLGRSERWMPPRGGAGAVSAPPPRPRHHHLAAAGAAILCTRSQGNPWECTARVPPCSLSQLE